MNVDEFELERETERARSTCSNIISAPMAGPTSAARTRSSPISRAAGRNMSFAPSGATTITSSSSSRFPTSGSPSDKRAAIYETIGLINEQLWLGHFELWATLGPGPVPPRHPARGRGRRRPHPPAGRDPGRSRDRGMRALLPGLPVRPLGRQDPAGSHRRRADRDPGRGLGSIRLRRGTKGPDEGDRRS